MNASSLFEDIKPEKRAAVDMQKIANTSTGSASGASLATFADTVTFHRVMVSLKEAAVYKVRLPQL